MKFPQCLFYACLALAVMLAIPYSARATEKRHISEYDISLGVMTIARASFTSAFHERGYKISGMFRSAGLASMITKISAETNVTGRILGNRLQAESYNLVYSSGKGSRTYDVAYRNGNVQATKVHPQPSHNPETWIPVPEIDLRSVLDPLSGMIFPGKSKACPRRLPIYDGESRMDLVLTHKGTKPFSTEGFEGEAVVCSIRYIPRSGYRRGRSDIEFLRKIDMEIWFAKAKSVDVYAPVYASIPTRVGQLQVTAVKYGD